MSEIGSIIIYQLDFLIPGMAPSFASSLKHILQSSKSRIYPLFRPQRKHLRTVLEENLGFFFERATTDVFAILFFERYS
ncbi:hypothetical protein A3I27_04240 [Candidatus Giovannonibacteria bacterium RIFCSPLOWO2_02_FULL_43_11b]|uniref:Uncharacterized protein n=1 Tax=Candidatus Giovannonibacteria bacterium RIFCSPHIGHO2_12_FULL_43_15 TaxID=1798341 RepID=A0A1F5WS87_9BACT|nr:MAG: hypothetical protein A2739_00605 [Candidatus Giovannonibacteria bacterium RIFCSPHIGHO2_01_FULL_43_100]OGF66960.1 MAG: hypothetical protein A3B97_03735 [Candidatus Giovannonibacteria bacterium RIFCSPHIGHO2_02_FULL_43_32]OGF78141.1 MAG: hypothetical protein A3F23_02985 [Candidatus Giovannonibacteria bacterium RIFCSPHIGHO2_12_FULL_43_15]OGF78548.1 MAG: hypothetical protein A3A15_02885 [Candidatus Giovannonibacteria bacterium RIFCSPLOWO2_01_FULL_43_60]OGF89871.1 MAG: hypothetical protein A3